MKAHYNTTGVLSRPLITLHTLRDQQVLYFHEQLYDLKTLFSGSLFTRHLSIPIDRFEHCNFTKEEALFSFAVMLLYDGVLEPGERHRAPSSPAPSWRRSRATPSSVHLPNQRAGSKLTFKLEGHARELCARRYRERRRSSGLPAAVVCARCAASHRSG